MAKFLHALRYLLSLFGLRTSNKPWEKESIPKEALLFRRVYCLHVDKKTLTPSSATFTDYDLSCDWNQYSTAEQSRELIGKEYKHDTTDFKNPNDFFICSLVVNDILELNIDHEIEHDPKQSFPERIGFPDNRAHSLVIDKNAESEKGKRDVKNRALLAQKANWVIFDKSEWETAKKLVTK